MSRKHTRVEIRPDGVAVVTLDHPDKPVNTLSPEVLEEFRERVEPLLDDPGVRAIVVASAKADTFIAGADLEILDGMTDPEEPATLSREGNALLSRIAASPKPVVAAVHGAALGGGMEVALACHFILASDDPATVFSQAEVMLGLLPAGGGTQRLVRKVGLTAALPLLLTGKRIRAHKAYRMGLVDAITTPGGIAETAARKDSIRGFRIVKQAEVMIIERLGKYHTTLSSGINIIWPFLDRSRKIIWRYEVAATPDTPKHYVFRENDRIDLLVGIQIGRYSRGRST